MQNDLFKTPAGYRPPEDIRVLMGCEKSGVGRNAFLKLGFDTFSCDLQPADDKSNRHFQCDVRDIMDDGWDVLIVSHPPCTRLCLSGLRWLHKPPKGKTLEQMWKELDEGCELFSDCWNATVPHVGVEQPIIHRHAAARIRNYRKYSQIVHPYHYGEKILKSTCWWLKELPNLKPTNQLVPPKPGTDEHKAWSAIHRCPPSAERSNIRSRTFQGHADAFARQWGDYVCNYSIAA